MVLCDAAQSSSDGKTSILGAGWRQCGPVLRAHAIVVIITFSSDEQDQDYEVRLELVDADGQLVIVPSPQGPMTIQAAGNLRPTRPDNVPDGQEVDAVYISEVGAGLPLVPGATYVWQLWIQNETRDDWRQTFYVRQAAPA